MFCTPTYSQMPFPMCEVNGSCKACSSFCNCCDSPSLNFSQHSRTNSYNIPIPSQYLHSGFFNTKRMNGMIWHAEVLERAIVMMEDVSFAMEKKGL